MTNRSREFLTKESFYSLFSRAGVRLPGRACLARPVQRRAPHGQLPPDSPLLALVFCIFSSAERVLVEKRFFSCEQDVRRHEPQPRDVLRPGRLRGALFFFLFRVLVTVSFPFYSSFFQYLG